MAKLAQRGISNLLVEGGPTVLSSLLESRLVDEAWVFTAPILIGGRSARSLLDGRGVQRMVDAIEAKTVHTQSSGRDTLQRLRLTTPG
jgi:riboflavin biosynthesis pyrimidine reductase